jgi:hypothetical protein
MTIPLPVGTIWSGDWAKHNGVLARSFIGPAFRIEHPLRDFIVALDGLQSASGEVSGLAVGCGNHRLSLDQARRVFVMLRWVLHAAGELTDEL